jgi:hypothetical protein
MVYHVSKEATEACTECPRDQACLQKDRAELCRVSCSVDGAWHFVVCAHEGPCPYKQKLWDRVLCGCPVRREIFRRYKV